METQLDETSKTASERPSGVMRALEKKAVSGAFWSILEYGSTTGLRVISSLVLTRLLVPADFGEMTLLSTLIAGITLLSDIGLGPSVIQSPRGDDPVFLNTAWTLQAIRGVALYIVAILISWPMSLIYHDPRLKVLLPVLALSTLLSGFYSTNLLTLSRHIGVRRLFAVDGSTSVVSLIITIAWASKWPSVWAILGGHVGGTIYRLWISHIKAVAPGPRNSFGWDKECLHSIVHFGKWIMLSTAIFFVASQADRLILAEKISFAMLGLYGLAYSLSDIPRQIILALGNRVAYPFIAKIIDLPIEEFRAQFFRYRRYTLLVGATALAIMVNWGNLIIFKLYPARYHDAAWMIPILSAGLWHTLLYQTTAPVLFSLGKPKYNAIGNAGYGIGISVGILVAFHYYGIFGAVIAVAAGDFPMYLVLLYGATRERIRPLRQDLVMTGVFIAMAATGYLIKTSVLRMMH